MANAVRERIDWFEKTLKDLKGKQSISSLYHFGYCPKCDDITEIKFYDAGDDWEPTKRGRTICTRCNISCMQFSGTQEIIKCTGDEIPPKLKRKWDHMHTRPQQIKIHKEKIRVFLDSLERECQEREDLRKEAVYRLRKFLPKET